MEPLAKISFIDAANKAVFLFHLSFKSTFIYAFMVALVSELVTFGLQNTVSFEGKTLSVTSNLFGFYLGLLFLVFLIGNCFILIKQNGLLTKEELNFKATLQVILARFPGILLSGIVFTFLWVIGLGFHLFPGILFMACFYVYLPGLLFAHKRAFESWRYSFSLVRKHFLSTLALVLLSLILLWTPPLITHYLGEAFFNNSRAYFGLEVTGMILITAFVLLLNNALNLVWFYLLHKNKQ